MEFCLLGDQNDRLAKIKTERHDIEIFNDNLRKKFSTSSDKVFI